MTPSMSTHVNTTQSNQHEVLYFRKADIPPTTLLSLLLIGCWYQRGNPQTEKNKKMFQRRFNKIVSNVGSSLLKYELQF